MQTRTQWFHALTDRLGVHGVAERLRVPLATVLRAANSDRHALRPALSEAVGRLMDRYPNLPNPPSEFAYTDPRHEKTIPLKPYPDEVRFFGRSMAFKAARWRYLHDLARRTQKDDPKSPLALRAKEDLLTLEIQLLRDNGMTLATSQSHSQAVNSPTIRLRERWEWRESELETTRAALAEIEGKMKKTNPKGESNRSEKPVR